LILSLPQNGVAFASTPLQSLVAATGHIGNSA
jgi:hypothetical protein